jgi:hypothetical protein
MWFIDLKKKLSDLQYWTITLFQKGSFIECFIGPKIIIGLIWIQIQGLDDQKLKKIYSWKTSLYFFDQKLHFIYP